MSEAKDGENSQKPQKVKLTLASLFPEKAEVLTSIGPLFVRHLTQTDIEHLRAEALEGEALGKAFARRLIGTIQDKESHESIDDAACSALTDDDWRLLLPVLASRIGKRDFQGDSDFSALGEAVSIDLRERSRRDKEAQEKIRDSIASSYSFLSEGPLSKLQAQMSGLQHITAALSGKEYLERSLGMSGVGSAARYMESETFKKNQAAMDAFQDSLVLRPEAFEHPEVKHFEPLRIPDASETVVGKAAIESAANTRETNAKMDSLVMVVGGLNQTLIESVLPAWFKEVESNQASAKQSFDQAAKSLTWTKWAVIVSVVVTGLTAWWQVSVTKSIDQANTEMQRSAETLLKEQLNAQKALIAQQSAEMEQLKSLLNKSAGDIVKSK